MRRRIILIWCLLVIPLAGGARLHAQEPLPRFVDGPCHFHAGQGYRSGKNLRCGTLIVPENPSVPGHAQVRLAVAVFRAPGPGRQPDPVVFLQGGPGTPILEDLGPSIDQRTASRIMGDHDLILVDQRGTGLSRPSLACPEVHRAVVAAVRKSAAVQPQVAAERAALQVCRNRLVHEGIDLDAYSTQNDAADIADLRVALALPQLNLYAASYGTRVALAIMRSYPSGVRSAVLDSVVPPQFNMFVDPNLAEARAFKAFFAGCRRARTCSRTYPHLERTFDRLLTHLDQQPIKLLVHRGSTSYTVPINGDEIAQFLRGAMYSSEGLSLLPQDIEQFNVGQRGALLDLYDWLTQGSGVADGMYRSVVCAEDGPFATAAALHASVADLPSATRSGALAYQRDELGICQIWKVQPANPAFRQPVSSTIPTLLVGGEFDPITLPSNVNLVTPALSHSYSFIFPGSGHGIRYSDECPDQIIDDFFDDPQHRPDSSCIAVMKEPF